jgi:hypothetical protein
MRNGVVQADFKAARQLAAEAQRRVAAAVGSMATAGTRTSK